MYDEQSSKTNRRTKFTHWTLYKLCVYYLTSYKYDKTDSTQSLYVFWYKIAKKAKTWVVFPSSTYLQHTNWKKTRFQILDTLLLHQKASKKRLDKLHEKIHFRSCCRNLRLHFSYIPRWSQGEKEARHTLNLQYYTNIGTYVPTICLSRYFNFVKPYKLLLPKCLNGWRLVVLSRVLLKWIDAK